MTDTNQAAPTHYMHGVQVMAALEALSQINDHFNCGGVYDTTVQQQMAALFHFLWSMTSHPPPGSPQWVSREEREAA